MQSIHNISMYALVAARRLFRSNTVQHISLWLTSKQWKLYIIYTCTHSALHTQSNFSQPILASRQWHERIRHYAFQTVYSFSTLFRISLLKFLLTCVLFPISLSLFCFGCLTHKYFAYSVSKIQQQQQQQFILNNNSK